MFIHLKSKCKLLLCCSVSVGQIVEIVLKGIEPLNCINSLHNYLLCGGRFHFAMNYEETIKCTSYLVSFKIFTNIIIVL